MLVKLPARAGALQEEADGNVDDDSGEDADADEERERGEQVVVLLLVEGVRGTSGRSFGWRCVASEGR